MRVLIACERSGVVRDAFIRNGHDAVSCDLAESEAPGPHIVGDAIKALHDLPWDMVIAFPPCTKLSRAGAVFWGRITPEERAAAEQFALAFWTQRKVKRVAVENPEGRLRRCMGKPSCVVQPYHHGHAISKKTLLWLRRLPPLKPSHLVDPEVSHTYAVRDAVERSRTFDGVGIAMADQWGGSAYA